MKLFNPKAKGSLTGAQTAGMPIIRILPEYLKLIKEGKKNAEVRSWYKDFTGQLVGLVLTGDELNKIRLVVKFGQILDIRDIHPDDKDMILDDCLVSKEFRENYECNFVYCIDEIYTIQ